MIIISILEVSIMQKYPVFATPVYKLCMYCGCTIKYGNDVASFRSRPKKITFLVDMAAKDFSPPPSPWP